MATDGTTHAVHDGRPLIGLVRACHFQPTLAVVAVTTALAVLAGRGPAGCVAVAVAVLAGQLSTGWSNDWFDAARDRAVGRTDKPIVAGDVSVGAVRAAACTALVAAVPLSLLSGWRAAVVHLVAIGSAWAYNLGLKATVVSPLPYAVSFGLVPAFVTYGLTPPVAPAAWVTATCVLLGVGAHLANAIPDVESDESVAAGVLVARIGVRVSTWLALTCLVAAVGLLATRLDAPAWVRVALVVVAVGGAVGVALLGRGQALFRYVMVLAVVAVVLLVVAARSITA